MSRVHADVLDDGLNVLTSTTALHICSQEPETHTEATDTYSLGLMAEPDVSEPGSALGGRQVVIGAIVDGIVTTTGDASHWALVDDERLLAAGALADVSPVVADSQFTLSEFTIGMVI